MRNSILFILLLFSSCNKKSDWILVCEIASQEKWSNYQDLNLRETALFEEIRKSISHPATVMSFEAIAYADPQQKWALWVEAAKADGMKDYDCPRLKELWSAPKL